MDNSIKNSIRMILGMRNDLPDTCEWNDVWDAWREIRTEGTAPTDNDWEYMQELIEDACRADCFPLPW